MSFGEIFSSMFWDNLFVIILIILSPILIFLANKFYKNYLAKKRKKYKQDETKKEDESYEPVLVSDQEKHLGINLPNSDFSNSSRYMKEIENLIKSLNTQKGKFTIRAVEATMIIDMFAENIFVDDDGVVNITLENAKEFSHVIGKSPDKFVTYIKAVEKKLDLYNEDNKIDLKDVLQMMRKARKVGLYLDNEDSDLMLTIKKAIHNSNYSDVLIKVIDTPERSFKDIADVENIVLKNMYTKEKKEETKVESVEQMGDRVKITGTDGTVIEKDDYMIYNLTTPEDFKKIQEEEDKKKKQSNNQRILPNQVVDNSLNEYQSLYGELSADEKEFNIFKDRSKKFYDKQLLEKISFNIEEKEIDFGDGKEFDFFFSQLFNKKYIITSNSPVGFIVDVRFNERVNRFITIDINYMLNFLYLMIQRKDRETFFNFVYKPDKYINIENVNSLLNKINISRNIFIPDKKDNTKFLSNIIYLFNKTTTIKVLVVLINTKTFQTFLEAEDSMYKDTYSEFKNIIAENVTTKSIGDKAKKDKADITINHDTFFRRKINERG